MALNIAPATPGVSQLASKWVLQVDTSNSLVLGTGTWVNVFAVQSFVPTKTDTMVDNTDYDSVGYGSQVPTLSMWGLTVGFARKRYSGALDVGQEFFRAQNDAKALTHVRWFDRTAGIEAYEAWGYPTWENQGGDAKTDEKINSTINGAGARNTITNPYATSIAPVVSSASPSGVAVGGLVRIVGAAFLGATLVKFGAVTATVTDIVSDSLIEAVMPAGSAGSAAVTVTNAVGVSNSLAYTRGA